MNRAEGACHLSPIWNQVISIPIQGGGWDLDSVNLHVSLHNLKHLHEPIYLFKAPDTFGVS